MKSAERGVTVITAAYLVGDWIIIGTNIGDVFLYSRSQSKRVKTVQKHKERIISVVMFNEQHVNKYSGARQEWANTFVGMTEKCVLVNTQKLQHEIINDTGDIGRSVHFWKDSLVIYINFADLVVYKILTKSIWDGEHETRLLEVTLTFALKVHEGKMFLTDIALSE